MGKKGKKGKKENSDDDWNENVKEKTLQDDGIERVSPVLKRNPFEMDLPEFNKADDGQDLGGLMSYLGKQSNKKKKKKGGSSNQMDQITHHDQEEQEPNSKPKRKGYDDEHDAADILEKLELEENIPQPQEKDEPKSAGKHVELADLEKELAEPPKAIQIKSKKEKERERKERAKLAKKKGAQKEVLAELDPDLEMFAAPKSEEDITPPPSSKTSKKGKKGPGGGAIAALREAMALQKAAEEEAARLEALEEKRLADLAAQKEAKEREKLEAREKKREREKAKKEELKKQGLYLTPAQKSAQAQQKLKLQAMLDAGLVVPALQGDDAGASETVKKGLPVYQHRSKKKFMKKQFSGANINEKKPEVKPEPVKEPEPEPEQEVQEEKAWDATSSDEEKPAEEEKVKDSWEASSSEEELEKKPEVKVIAKSGEKKEAKPPAKPIVPVKEAKKQAQNPESSESEQDDSEQDDDDSDDSEEDSSDEEMTVAEKLALQRKEEAAARRQERIAASYAARSKDNLRSPICCILGHVDTGKTKLLDKIRQTNVQEGEAGGITQQIGATYFPLSAIEEKTAMIHKGGPSGYKLPGLLVIDTPGHESFTNLRSRGSSLCNIAVLVVDIVHGLEPQTIESLNMLRARKTPFIVALNKIDRLFDWKTHANYPTRDTLALQKASVMSEFQDRVSKTIVEFAEQGLNACLYWENKNLGRNVSLVPTSAVTGEGVPDLLHLLMDLSQNRITERLMYLSELECTVLEVKVIEGLGTTIDVILSNGVLNEGDKICICGLNGPIVTQIRALLTPQPMRELRVKSVYQHHKTVKASLGIKISAPDLEKAIAGSRLLLIGPDDDEEEIMEEVMADLSNLMMSLDKSGKGVCVQASTLGSLEALLSFLKDMKIPVSGINIGPVHKKDIIRASIMLERCKEYAQILAFDVPIEKEAEQLATDMGVQIFSANIIYHLFDQYTAHMKQLEEQKRKDAMPSAVFPCVLKMVPEAIFNKRSPIIIGVDVAEGILKVGTPLCVVSAEGGAIFDLGKVVAIELNHKPKPETKRGDPSVAIRIECPSYQTQATYGRHFTQNDLIYSKISRDSIDVLKNMFRDSMGKEDWVLVVKLKKVLGIN